jgi:cyclic pyranopterin phosphate synthase
VSAQEIRDAVEAEFGPIAPSEIRVDAGPARYWRTAEGREVGIISAMTEHFCSDCNRLRLTATGDLHACLGHDDAISLRDVMRSGLPDEELVRAIAGAVSGKRAGHTFERDGTGGPTKDMIAIGG